MKPAIVLLLLLLSLVGCRAVNESRHPDYSSLEKPPGDVGIKLEASANESGQSADSGVSVSQDLFSDVYRNEDKATEIRIKRPVDAAWALVGKAILLNKLEIIGNNRKQGRYQVAYQSEGLFGGFSLLSSNKVPAYSLKLEEINKETVVTVSKIEDEGDSDPSMLKDGAPDYSYDNSEKLATLIFNTLHGVDVH